MKSLSVVHILEATGGGTARHLTEIVPALASADMKVHVVCATKREPQFLSTLAQFRSQGIAVTECEMCRSIAPWRDFLSVLSLRRIISRLDVDIIHVHSAKAGALGRLAAGLTGKATVVYTPHAYAFLNLSNPVRCSFYWMIEYCLSYWTDAYIAVSDSERLITIGRSLSPPSRVFTVPNGCYSGVEESPIASRQTQPTATIRLGCLTRLEPQKRPRLLLELAKHLKQKGLDFRFCIEGDGSLRNTCQELASKYELMSRVEFRGHQKEPDEFFQNIDIFVSTSQYEGLPYSLLDAMARGLPIVAFDVAGVQDAVVNEATGFLAMDGDIEHLAEYVIGLSRSPQARMQLGAAARKRVAEHFSFQQQICKLQSVYKALSTSHRYDSHSIGQRNRSETTNRELVTRVLFVSQSGELGGAERTLLDLIETIDKNRFRILVMCPVPSPLAARLISFAEAIFPSRCRHLGRRHLFGRFVFLLPTYLLQTHELIRQLGRYRIDVIHSNTSIAQIWVAAAAWWTNVPCVWVWRDFYDYPRLNRILARAATTSVGISKSVVGFVRKQLGNQGSVQQITNGVLDRSSDSVTYDRRPFWGLDREKVVIAMIGQLVPRKGQDVLLKAFSRARIKEPKLHLVLAYSNRNAAEKTAEQTLKQLAEENGCHRSISFLGYVEDIQGLLRDVEMVVIPSIREPFGRVAVEAMFAKLPVIATNVDGLSEIVLEDLTGLLVPPGDADALAEAIGTLAADPELRDKLGKNGREHAIQRYSIARLATEMGQLYVHARSRKS